MDKFKELSREIQSREKAIILFKKFADILKNNKLTDEILQHIIIAIKDYRILCIQIVNLFQKIREYSSYYVGVKKFNLESLAKLFNYDRHYLVKVRKSKLTLR